MAANRGSFNEVSPWIYGITGTVRSSPRCPAGRRSHGGMEQLRSRGPAGPVDRERTNGQWAYEPVADMLHNPAAMTRHINDIVALVQRERYDGIDIDYEDLRPATGRLHHLRDPLADAFHDKDKILSIAVFAKTTDAGEDQRNVAQDYAAIGAAADEVRLMAYDYHWAARHRARSRRSPGSARCWTTPRPRYPREKIVLGIPVSGYDWVDGGARSSAGSSVSDAPGPTTPPRSTTG